MPTTAAFAVEPAPIIPPPPIEKAAIVAETPPVMVAASMSIDDIKQAILSLIQENNAEFKQFLDELMVDKNLPIVEKETEQIVEMPPVKAVQKEPLHWSEMAYWKAYPDRKPLDPRELGGEPLSKEFFDGLLAFAINPETRITDDLAIYPVD